MLDPIVPEFLKTIKGEEITIICGRHTWKFLIPHDSHEPRLRHIPLIFTLFKNPHEKLGHLFHNFQYFHNFDLTYTFN